MNKITILLFALSIVFAAPVFAQSNSDQLPTFQENPDNNPNPGLNDLPGENDLQLPNEEDSRKVLNYLDEAERNYREILEDEKGSEVRTMDRRIESNKALGEEQRRKYEQSQDMLRRMRTEYLYQYDKLKSSFQDGKIDKETYEAELTKLNSKFEYQTRDVASDVDFYRRESKETTDRIQTLEDRNRVNKLMLKQTERSNPPSSSKRKVKERDPLPLELFVKKIDQIDCLQPRNAWRSAKIR